MSREILAFSVLAGSALGSFVFVPVAVTALIGLVAVFTSAMIYIDTHRHWWSGMRTGVSFFGTVAKLGASGAAALTGDAVCTALALGSGVALCLIEPRVQQGAALSLRVVRERLSKVAGWRRGLAAAAMGCQALALVVPQLGSVLGPMAFVCSVIACVCERVIFFKAVDALKMPGGLTA
jgi:DMSO reductase anchor subunit